MLETASSKILVQSSNILQLSLQMIELGPDKEMAFSASILNGEIINPMSSGHQYYLRQGWWNALQIGYQTEIWDVNHTWVILIILGGEKKERKAEAVSSNL